MAEVVVVRGRRGWWAGRSLRERWLILFMLALLALVLIWFLVLRPLSDARAAAEERLAAATSALGRARAGALMARPTSLGDGSGQPPIPLPLEGSLRQQAADQGFTNAQIAGQGADRARLTLPSARAQPFLAWIGQLERRGVTVESLTVRANADQTVAAEASLRAGGRS